MVNAEGSGVGNFFRRTWRVVRLPLLVILLLYIALVIYRVPAVMEKQKSDKVVAQIHAQKLTINDVNGEHLPPPPDPKLVDATIEGIDANGNGIRDDVELAIFKKYPNSARIRAAELQYAMELENELVNVFSVETLTAAAWEEDRGFFCIDGSFPSLPKTSTSEEFKQQDVVFEGRIHEVQDLVFNTDARKQKRKDVYEKFMSSHSSPGKEFCDVDLSS